MLVTTSDIHKKIDAFLHTRYEVNVIKDGVPQEIVLEKQTIVHLSQMLFLHPSHWMTPTLLFWLIIARGDHSL